MECRHPSSHRPKKPILPRKTEKCCSVYDKGPLLIEVLHTTVNAEVHCSTLVKLKQVVKNKQKDKLLKKIVLLQDNARPHAANKTVQLKTGNIYLKHFDERQINYKL